MAEYLLPTNYMLTIAQKQKMFSIKNRMVEISDNFPNKGIPEICSCGESEIMAHIYNVPVPSLFCVLFNTVKAGLFKYLNSLCHFYLG